MDQNSKQELLAEYCRWHNETAQLKEIVLPHKRSTLETMTFYQPFLDSDVLLAVPNIISFIIRQTKIVNHKKGTAKVDKDDSFLQHIVALIEFHEPVVTLSMLDFAAYLKPDIFELMEHARFYNC